MNWLALYPEPHSQAVVQHLSGRLQAMAPHMRHPETGHTLQEVAQGLPASGLMRRPDVVPWCETIDILEKEKENGSKIGNPSG